MCRVYEYANYDAAHHKIISGEHYEVSPVRCCSFSRLTFRMCKYPNNGEARSDPLEGFNRQMFDFNYYVLDPYILRPVAVVWRDYVPPPARNGLSNFLGNLEEPASMLNSVLRGDFERSKTFWSFLDQYSLWYGWLN